MIKNSYLLSLISELQDQLQRAKIFSNFDISDAYNWIQIKSEEEWKTIMRMCFRLYKYMVMSFRLINASATFQTYINNVLREHLNMFVIVYLDDILVYSKNEKDYKKHMRQILNALKKADLRIMSEKSQFYQTEIEFLSYIITDYEIKINSEKVRIITEWPVLKLVKETQSFLEFVNFYQKFIQNYSKVAAALTDIIQKE